MYLSSIESDCWFITLTQHCLGGQTSVFWELLFIFARTSVFITWSQPQSVSPTGRARWKIVAEQATVLYYAPGAPHQGTIPSANPGRIWLTTEKQFQHQFLIKKTRARSLEMAWGPPQRKFWAMRTSGWGTFGDLTWCSPWCIGRATLGRFCCSAD